MNPVQAGDEVVPCDVQPAEGPVIDCEFRHRSSPACRCQSRGGCHRRHREPKCNIDCPQSQRAANEKDDFKEPWLEKTVTGWMPRTTNGEPRKGLDSQRGSRKQRQLRRGPRSGSFLMQVNSPGTNTRHMVYQCISTSTATNLAAKGPTSPSSRRSTEIYVEEKKSF